MTVPFMTRGNPTTCRYHHFYLYVGNTRTIAVCKMTSLQNKLVHPSMYCYQFQYIIDTMTRLIRILLCFYKLHTNSLLTNCNKKINGIGTLCFSLIFLLQLVRSFHVPKTCCEKPIQFTIRRSCNPIVTNDREGQSPNFRQSNFYEQIITKFYSCMIS